MALPGSDPYKDAAPTVSGQDASGAYLELSGTNFSGWCIATKQDEGVGAIVDIPDKNIVSVWNSSGSSFTNQMQKLRIAYPCDADDVFVIYNPVLYTRQTAAHIMLAAAHYHAGIIEADIDVTSFDAVHTYEDGEGSMRSLALCDRSLLDLFKEMMEHTYGVYLYINGQHQLACGYLERGYDLYTSAADWYLDNENVVSIKSFDKVRDRSYVQEVKWGYDVSSITPGKPVIGEYKIVRPDASDHREVLGSVYEATTVDDSDDDYGDFVDFDEFFRLVIEVDGIGLLMDIDEYVEVFIPNLGLARPSGSSTAGWHFLIHRIEINPETMTTKLTLLTGEHWEGIPI